MSENECVVCFNKNIRIYSIGECDHPVCYECSARMRVLCGQNECSICRQNMTMVVFAERIQPFANLKRRYHLFDKNFKIAFSNPSIERAFYFLLINVCKKCSNQPTFETFDELRMHVENTHNLYCCELCYQNLKIFPKEKRWYSKNDLQKHERVGDSDDRSHRGHPLCKFCDIRYLDNDDLYRHLRRNHYFCHICDAEGIQSFYGTYDSLRNHFRKRHFLCEEGDCLKEQFTSVFRNEADFEAHKAVTHKIGKQGSRHARMKLHITLLPRSGIDGTAITEPQTNDSRQQVEQDPPWVNSVPSLEQAFPALGRGSMSAPIQRRSIMRPSSDRLAFNDQNFPALSSEAFAPASSYLQITNPAASISVTTSTFSINRKPPPSQQRVTNSLHINPTVNNTIPSSSGAPPLNWAPKPKIKHEKPKTEKKTIEKSSKTPKDEFPTLGSNRKSKNQTSSLMVQIGDNSTATGVKNKSKNGNSQSQNNKVVGTSTEEGSSRSNTYKKVKMKEKDHGNKNSRLPQEEISSTSASPVNKKTKNSTCMSQSINSKTNKNIKPENNGSLSSFKLHDNITNKRAEVKLAKGKKTENANSKSEKVFSKNSESHSDDKNEKLVSENCTPEKKDKNQVIKNREKLKTSKDSDLNKENISHNSNNETVKNVDKNCDVERKKTELKIGPLINNEINVPYYSHSQRAIAPPPGFSNCLSNGGNDLTFTNSHGQSFYINNEAREYGYLFKYPANFAIRNVELLDKISSALLNPGGDCLKSFKDVSISFKNGIINTDTYYTFCKYLMKEDKFDSIFKELVVLLPNINKQQDLWRAYLKDKPNSNISSEIEICTNCCQILAIEDIASHLADHV